MWRPCTAVVLVLLVLSGCFTTPPRGVPIDALPLNVDVTTTPEDALAYLVAPKESPAWQLRITPWSASVLRIEMVASGQLYTMSGLTRYGFIEPPRDPPRPVVRGEPDTLVFETERFVLRISPSADPKMPSVTFNGAPWRLESGPSLRLSADLAPDERLYGLGEIFSGIEHRGKRLDAHIRYGTSDQAHLSATPFLMSSRGYGVLVDTTYTTSFDMGNKDPALMTVTSADPATRVFFFAGPSFKSILSENANLTGHAYMPPKWMFGYIQSKFGYANRQELETIAARLRSEGYPADGLVLDFFWRDNARMEWVEAQWPAHQQMLDGLHAQGFKVVLHEDTEQMRFYPDAPAGYRYATQRDESPGLQILDVSNPAATRWYWDAIHLPLLKEATPLAKGGVDGFWIDEIDWAPEGGNQPYHSGMLPAEMHNLYPNLFNKAVAEPYEATGQRSALITRSQWTGGQRYPHVWSGDTATSFEQFGKELHAGLSMGLSGFPFWGDDLGGFWGKPSDELHVRWAAQFGAFNPFMRVHGTGATIPLNAQSQLQSREPWSYGAQAQAIFREYDQLRYRLMPYIYSVAHDSATSGQPMMRALVLDYQDDPQVARLGNQYLFGPSLLVAPIHNETQRGSGRSVLERDVYLPAGQWHDYWTGAAVQGPAWVRWAGPLERFPVYARPGAIVPMGPDLRFVDEKPLDPLTVHVWPNAAGSFTLVEDDGSTTQYKQGVVSKRSLNVDPDPKGYRFDYGAAAGSYETKSRAVHVVFHGVQQPTEVRLDGQPIESSFEAGRLTVRVGPTTSGFSLDVRGPRA